MFRDTSMNAQTETEKLNDVDKQKYRRNQFGGSFGGPIVKDKAHFFGAVERTNQDTFQSVSTLGLFPTLDGIYATPYRETLTTVKATTNVSPQQYLSVRYGYNKNNQPYGVDPNVAAERVGREHQQVQLDQHEPQLGAGRREAERVHLPVRRLRQRDHGEQPRSVADVPERRLRSARASTRRRRRSRRSTSSATTSPGTWRAWASGTTSRRA